MALMTDKEEDTDIFGTQSSLFPDYFECLSPTKSSIVDMSPKHKPLNHTEFLTDDLLTDLSSLTDFSPSPTDISPKKVDSPSNFLSDIDYFIGDDDDNPLLLENFVPPLLPDDSNHAAPPEFTEVMTTATTTSTAEKTFTICPVSYKTYLIARAVLRCHAAMKQQSRLPKINRIKFTADLAKLYIDSRRHRGTIERHGKNGRVVCPPLTRLTEALKDVNPLPIFCRRPGEPITDWDTREDLVGSRATEWSLVLGHMKPKFKLRLPGGDPGDVCHVTQAKARQGCTTSNWASFEFVIFGIDGRVLCSVPLNKLREVIEMFRGPSLPHVTSFFRDI